ncbi:MAG TPA: VOC family protein [Steroidobacteraceae bacterium]|nr:VOC family protein [Steroidobacteraceae bacterium]
MSEPSPAAQGGRTFAGHPLQAIRALDYTILFARDLPAMRNFYLEVMRFELYFEIADNWIEFRVGGNVLALAKPGLIVPDQPPPVGTASAQLAFRVRKEEVDGAEAALRAEGVPIVSPATDQRWGHRTMFFRDPDGNLLEIYADI